MTAAVVDASALVALLLDDGEDGRWVTHHLAARRLLAPDLLDYETTNALRRLEGAGRVSREQAAQARADLLDLAVERWPYAPLADRIWQLRANLTVYDAAYVATAELTGATLVTLDGRIAAAPGLRCAVVRPPAG